jgi:uncharacterized membrane protein SirB2
MDYLTVKHLHMSLAFLSGGFFAVRGLWMLMDSPWLHKRWVKTVPHIVDAALLASAIVLAVWISQYPLAHGWLTAKVTALIAYILFGVIALRPGRPKAVRAAAFGAALLSFIYIVGVAMSKNPAFFLR